MNLGNLPPLVVGDVIGVAGHLRPLVANATLMAIDDGGLLLGTAKVFYVPWSAVAYLEIMESASTDKVVTEFCRAHPDRVSPQHPALADHPESPA